MITLQQKASKDKLIKAGVTVGNTIPWAGSQVNEKENANS